MVDVLRVQRHWNPGAPDRFSEPVTIGVGYSVFGDDYQLVTLDALGTYNQSHIAMHITKTDLAKLADTFADHASYVGRHRT